MNTISIKHLINYPVAGMQGHAVEHLNVNPNAIEGNRVFAVVDVAEIETWLRQPEAGYPLRLVQTLEPKLVLFTATNNQGNLELKFGTESIVTPISISLDSDARPKLETPVTNLDARQAWSEFVIPVRVSWRSGSARWAVDCGDEVAEWLSQRLDRRVRLFKAIDASNKNHFTWYTDLHLINLASVKQLAQATGVANLTYAPFRPNIVIDDADPFTEVSWTQVTIGETQFQVKPCERCGYVTINQASAERSGGAILKELVSHYQKNFGVYLSAQSGRVETAGAITIN